MSEVRKILGLRIKELRQAKKMKQAQLAEMIGIEPRIISKIESGFHFPKDEHLLSIANALDVELKDLFTTSHLKDKNTLVLEINNILSNIEPQKLKEIYRIIQVLTR